MTQVPVRLRIPAVSDLARPSSGSGHPNLPTCAYEISLIIRAFIITDRPIPIRNGSSSFVLHLGMKSFITSLHR